MVRHRKPPSQTWRTFLDNHVADLVSVDFFTVRTATFRILYVFVILRHDRREVCSISMLLKIQLRNGRHSRLWRLFPLTRHHAIYCEIAIVFTVNDLVGG